MSVGTLQGTARQAVEGAKQDVALAFRNFDSDGNGFIDATELQSVLRRLGFTGNTEEMFEVADVNRDGVIDYEEFISWLFADDISNQSDPFLCSLGTLQGCCATGKTPSNTVSDSGLAPLVFIHGALGSHLATLCKTSNEKVKPRHYRFLTARQASGMWSSDITLPLRWEGGRQLYREEPLWPVKCIESVGGSSVYKPLFDWLRRLWGPDFHPFAYDWRRDANENADLLIKFLEAVVLGSGRRPAVVIAHSGGGLLAMAALNERPQLIHSVVFCGATLGPSLVGLSELHHGRSATGEAFLPKVIPVGAYCSFPSYYCNLAHHPEAATGGATPWAEAKDEDGTSVFWNPSVRDSQGNDLNLMDPAVWEEHSIGGLWQDLAVGSMGLNEERLREHQRHVCSSATRLQGRAAPRSGVNYPPLRAVASRSHETPCRYRLSATGALTVEEGGWEPGDGRVPWGAARPGRDVPCPMLASAHGHERLPCDLHAVSAALLQAFREREARNDLRPSASGRLPFQEEVFPMKSSELKCAIL